ncbi:MAG: uracil-DNA glycosylase [Treponema sp.]|jgi:DNA polymerase|nr:uracil-DNA glycosylase [Treponema sp.]
MADKHTQELLFFLDTAEDFLRDGQRRTRHRDTAPEMPSMDSYSVENDSVEAIAEEVRLCSACGLHSMRHTAVPGEGVQKPHVLVIGEAPGADEDSSGRPFVGRAGQLLDKMLEAIDCSRDKNCFITNMIKCRPPENRDPQPAEVHACKHFLVRLIALIEPKVILCVGRIAAQALLNTTVGIGELRGKWTAYYGIPFFPIYHPSALLRNPNLKRPTWEDLKLFRTTLDQLISQE